MGWLGTPLYHTSPVTAHDALAAEFGEDFLREQVIDSARKPAYGGEGYAVYAAVRDHERPWEVGGVVLLYSTGTSRFEGGRELSTKRLPESMGPAEDECPERILRLLSPLTVLYPDGNEHAAQWRERCWKRIRDRKAQPRIKAGDVLDFATAIKFTNGDELRLFRFTGKGNSFVPVHIVQEPRVAPKVVECGGRYSISGWRDRTYQRVVSADQVAA